MAEILATIAAHVREVVAVRRRELPQTALRERALYAVPTRGFAKALAGTQRRIVAEARSYWTTEAAPSGTTGRPG